MTDTKNGEREDVAEAGRRAARQFRPQTRTRPPRNAGAEEARKLALVIAGAALEKKALAVEILDVVGKVDYADFLVLMTGRSNRQVDALSQAIEEACAKKKAARLVDRGHRRGRRGCSSTSATWSSTSSRKKRAASTTSRGSGSTPSAYRSPDRARGNEARLP